MKVIIYVSNREDLLWASNNEGVHSFFICARPWRLITEVERRTCLQVWV